MTRLQHWCLVVSVAAVAASLGALLLSWRGDQRIQQNAVAASWNLRNASWNLSAASVKVDGLAGQLADRKTGVAPAVRDAAGSLKSAAAPRTTTAENVKTLSESLNTQVNAIGGTVVEVTGKLGPVMVAAADTTRKVGTLANTYSALPGQIGTRLQPSWLALEPEITCRHADGTGFGGCWHSRITGLMGEAVRVGGVFTQTFPSLADSVTGIASDAHGFTRKYVMPHPMRKRDYFKAAGTITLGLGVAGLRGGVF
jgi:hypothetical protein